MLFGGRGKAGGIKVVNTAGTGPGGFICAIYGEGGVAGVPGADGHLLSTNNNWQCIHDPASDAGRNVVSVVVDQIQRAQVRGCLKHWTIDPAIMADSPNFRYDSAGQLVPTAHELSFKIGDGLFTGVLKKLAETWLEFRAPASLGTGYGRGRVLQLFVAEGLALPGGGFSVGAGGSTAITFTPGTNILALTHDRNKA